MGENLNDSIMCHYSDISSPEASSSEGKPIFTQPNECLDETQ